MFFEKVSRVLEGI